MPTFYFTAFQRDSVIAIILLFLVIVSGIQSRSKRSVEDDFWPPIISRYWNLVGLGLMLIGIVW